MADAQSSEAQPADARAGDAQSSHEGVLEDLLAEHDSLDAVVSPLPAQHWALATPSPGWDVRDQVAHLTYFDRAGAQAITDPEAFGAARDRLVAEAMADPGALDRATLGTGRGLTPTEVLSDWRSGRRELAAAAGTLTGGRRVEWYGPSMSPRSFLTARLMETWAHGLDITDALDAAGVDHVRRAPTHRLRHVAHLGVVTRGWSYGVRGMEPPGAEVRVEVAAPGGDTWAWGEPSAQDRIEGPAWDFCAVVTQRRHPEETSLRVSGEAAREWMSLAQAFAGGPTDGPAPGRTRRG